MANYLSDKTGVQIDASLDKADISYGTDNTGITSNSDLHVNNGAVRRGAANKGHLTGRQGQEQTDNLTNPIFTIGTANDPGTNVLNNMFGVGFCSVAATFISHISATGWGMYLAAGGDAKLFLDASSGRYYGNGATYENAGTGSVKAVTFNNDNGQVGFIQTSGTTTLYSVSSDERLKENIEPITDAFDLVKSIIEGGALQYFTFKNDPSTKVPGFLAQRLIACGAGDMVAEGEGSLDLDVEIGSVYEKAVIESVEILEEMTDSNGNTRMVGSGEFTEKVITPEKKVTPCGVDQSKAVPHLMQLCYDQQMQINALTARLDAANI